LLEWDGTIYREFRMAFPPNITDGQVTYEVPFGVVRVGQDEIPGAAGERYVTPAADVHPRGIENWINVSDDRFGMTLTSSVAVWDYVDMTDTSNKAPVLQPILLASRHSCHGEGLPYSQKGNHHYQFSMTSHQPGWENGYRFGRQTNEPLQVVFRPTTVRSVLPENHTFFSVDADHLIISTIKKSEDDESLTLRLFDIEGIDTAATISTWFELLGAARTNIIEAYPIPIPVDKKSVDIEVGHHAIETYRLTF